MRAHWLISSATCILTYSCNQSINRVNIGIVLSQVEQRLFRIHLNDNCGSVAVAALNSEGEPLTVLSVIEAAQIKLRNRFKVEDETWTGDAHGEASLVCDFNSSPPLSLTLTLRCHCFDLATVVAIFDKNEMLIKEANMGIE